MADKCRVPTCKMQGKPAQDIAICYVATCPYGKPKKGAPK